MTIVAAFEPFDGRRRNRSWEAVRRLPPRPGLELRQLPVDFARLPRAIAELLAASPAALLLVGEADRPLVTVEQVALNLADSSGRPDNAGAVVQDRALVGEAGAPLALRASWDAHAVAARLNRQAIPAEPSFHAGTFACNASLYLALRALAGRAPVGFLHLPLRRWPFGPRLPTLTRAVDIAVQALAATGPTPSGR